LTASCGLLKEVPQKAPLLALAQINEHPLGKSILSLASIHMKAQGPLEDLPVLLQEIYDDLISQQAQTEAQHERDTQYCTETEAVLRTDITRHGIAYGLYKGIKRDNEAALVNLHAHLDEVEAFLEANERRTADGTAQREQQHATYETDLANNIDAIDACSQAISLLNAMRAGTSFIQLKNKFQKVQERLEATKSSTHSHIYTPLIKALAQITSKADKEAIGRILDLLTSLLGQLQAARGTIEETEATQAAFWDQELADLTSEHARLSQDEIDTTADIETREETVADATENMTFNFNAAQAALENLNNLEAECAAKEAAYEKVRDELAREVEVVAALQEHIANSFGGFSEYIGSAPQAL